MSNFSDVITWLGENWGTLIEVTGGLLGVASLITGLTKSPKDDKVIAKIQGWLGLVSFLKHKDKDGTFKVPLKKD